MRLLAFRPLSLTPDTLSGVALAPAKAAVSPVVKQATSSANSAAALQVATKPEKSAGQKPTPVPGTITQNWSSLSQALELTGIVKQFASHCQLLQQSDSQIELGLDVQHRGMLSDRLVNSLEQALQQYYQSKVRLRVRVAEALPEQTPAQVEQVRVQDQQAQLTKDIQQDENIRFIQAEFGATIVADSIKAK